MKKLLRITCLGACAAFAVTTALGQDERSLTLDECLAIALSDNPTVRVADMEVRRMDYSKKEVIGQFLPSIDFGANYSRTLAKQVAYMNMDNFPGMGSGSTEDTAPESCHTSRTAASSTRAVAARP